MALICGLMLPQGMDVGRMLILPALAIIITVTLLKFPRGFFRHPGSLLYASIQSNLMNYIVLANFIILTAAFLVHKQQLWIGTVLVAATPLSLETIRLGNLLHAEKKDVCTSMAGTYMGALLIVPLVGLCFLKYIHLNYWNIIVLILCLIFLPLVISRLAIEKDWDTIIKKDEHAIMNFCQFIVFYTIASNSSPYLSAWSPDLFMIVSIAFVSTFVFYILIRRTAFYFHTQKNKINTSLLSGTLKEFGLAGGIALTLFDPEVVVPSLIFGVLTYLYMFWLKVRFGNAEAPENHER